MTAYNEDKKALDKEIQKTIDNLNEMARLDKQIRLSKQESEELEEKLRLLKEQWEKEAKDVERLKKTTFSNLLHTLIHDKSEKLEKEQAELIEAKLKYENASFHLSQSKKKIETMKMQYKKYISSPEKYKILLEKKRDLIQRYDTQKWAEIKMLMEEKKIVSSEMKEVNEAILAGNKVISGIEQAQSSLGSAENWGLWDMFGGGLISTMIKHEKMEAAQNHINEIQGFLRDFYKEMKDVSLSVDIDLNLDSFLGFADYFFDGLLVDWAVQSKINEAQYKVESVLSEVNEILNHLQQRLNYLKEKQEKLQSEIERATAE